MLDKKQRVVQVFSSANANGAGKIVKAIEHENIYAVVVGTGGANLKVKFPFSFKGVQPDSIDKGAKPDFSSSASISNPWDYSSFINMQSYTNTAISGDTGVDLTGGDGIEIVRLIVKYPMWVTAVVTNYTAGNVSVQLILI